MPGLCGPTLSHEVKPPVGPFGAWAVKLSDLVEERE
jgi:hypothetical protein